MNFKLSYYTIFSQINENVYIIYATRTGKTLVIGNENYELLVANNFDQLPETLFFKLINISALVPLDEDELGEIIEENRNAIKDSSTMYQVIQPTANCQLGCGYCGQQHTKDQFSPDYDEKLLKRLEHKFLKNPEKFTELQISWFGSEPLMGLTSIRRLAPLLQNLAKKYSAKYSSKMVTNGLALKKNIFLELVHNYNVSSFEITLDGTAEYHDKRRFVKSGEKSFDIIFQNLVDIFNLEEFELLKVRITIRCNVDKTNYEGVIPLIEKMRSHNFHNKVAGFYVAPIHSWGNDAHKLSLEKSEFAEREIDWFLALYKNGFLPWMIPTRNKEVCMAVDPNAELVDAFGEIFNCTEVSYVPVYKNTNYELGNIMNVSSEDELSLRPFLDWNDKILEKDTELHCPTCKMLPVCGGACPKSWKEEIIPCPAAKSNIIDRLALSYLITQKGIPFLQEEYHG